MTDKLVSISTRGKVLLWASLMSDGGDSCPQHEASSTPSLPLLGTKSLMNISKDHKMTQSGFLVSYFSLSIHTSFWSGAHVRTHDQQTQLPILLRPGTLKVSVAAFMNNSRFKSVWSLLEPWKMLSMLPALIRYQSVNQSVSQLILQLFSKVRS